MSDLAPASRAPRTLPGATILQIIPTLADTHFGRTALEIALALLQSGARAIVASGDGPLVSELQGFGGEWVRLEPETANPLRMRGNARRLEALIGAERVDLVHATGLGASRSAAAAKARTGTWVVHSYLHEARPRRLRDAAYGRALARGDRLLVPSAYAAGRLVERHRATPERITVIAPRIDTAKFNPAAVTAGRLTAIRQAWRIRRGERVALVPGRIDPAHGQLDLIDAVRILTNGGLQNLLFVLAGDERDDPEHARAVVQRVAAQGLGGIVRRVGICPDMAAAYAAADLVVVPAVEPPTLSRAAGEALAMARPVVASAIGALPEFVLVPPRVPPEQQTGWLTEPGDPTALASALALAESVGPEAHRVLGARGRQLAEATFAPAEVTRATLAVYSTVLEGEI